MLLHTPAAHPVTSRESLFFTASQVIKLYLRIPWENHITLLQGTVSRLTRNWCQVSVAEKWSLNRFPECRHNIWSRPFSVQGTGASLIRPRSTGKCLLCCLRMCHCPGASSGSPKWHWIQLCHQIWYDLVHVSKFWPSDYFHPTSWLTQLSNCHQLLERIYPYWKPSSCSPVHCLCPLCTTVKTVEVYLRVGAESQLCGGFSHRA